MKHELTFNEITMLDVATAQSIERKKGYIGKLCNLTDENVMQEIKWTNDLREKFGLKRL